MHLPGIPGTVYSRRKWREYGKTVRTWQLCCSDYRQRDGCGGRRHMVAVLAHAADSAGDKQLEPGQKKERRTPKLLSRLRDEYVCQLLQLCMCTCWKDQWCRGRKLFLPNRRVIDRCGSHSRDSVRYAGWPRQ